MKELFVPYQESLELKELGFDENCIATYEEGDFDFNHDGEFVKNSECPIEFCTAPLFSQAFKWFRDKYNLNGYCYQPNETEYWGHNLENKAKYDSYEEAKLECVLRLIEIVKKQER